MWKQKVRNWRHVFKLDPNKKLTPGELDRICSSNTDALLIGGTDGVTFDNTNELLFQLQDAPIPCIQEVSNIPSIIPGFSGYFVPTILNTEQVYWILGAHHEAIKTFGDWIPWRKICIEGYVVLNPDAKVAQVTEAKTNLTEADIFAYARIAEMLQLPIFYLEYSGKFGQVEMLQAARRSLNETLLCYGGGITSESQAKLVAQWADIVVVGNLIYDDLEAALKTVQWVKETQRKEEERSK